MMKPALCSHQKVHLGILFKGVPAWVVQGVKNLTAVVWVTVEVQV